MKILNNKTKLFIVIFATIIIIGISITIVYAWGSYLYIGVAEFSMNLEEGKPSISSTKEGNKEKITISNIGNEEAYIRVKIFTPTSVTTSSSSANWTLNSDGYYYYSNPISVGASTSEIVINFSTSRTDSYSSLITAEMTRVRYNENGTKYANWNAEIN